MATKIMTAHGNAQLDTAQNKFGTSSGFFPGAGAYIDTSDSEDFNISGSNCTIDMWLKRNTIGTPQYICGQCNSSFNVTSFSIGVQLSGDNKLYVFVGHGGSLSLAVSSIAITDSNWHHVAVVSYENIITIYLDGVANGTLNITGITINNSTYKFSIGRNGEYNANYFNGWIDEFRFSKGIARWTSNFTPPAAAYTADAYTVLLLHMDGADGSTNFIDDSESSSPSPLANTKVNIGGAWKSAVDGHVKVDGIWKPISSIHTKIDGVWKQA